MPDPSAKVHLLVHRADGGGGVVKTVFNLANELVGDRPVEIISLTAAKDELRFRLDPRVELTWLSANYRRPGVPLRPHRFPGESARSDVELDAIPTALAPAAEPLEAMSAWTDRVLAQALARITEGVIVSTRPSLHVAAVRHAPPGVVLVGQDHLNFVTRSASPAVMSTLAEAVPRLDAFVVLTRDDERDYRAWSPGSPHVVRIPNGHASAPMASVGDVDTRIVVSAGRFVPEKGFDRLVEAWAGLGGDRDGWQLHLYGAGADQEEIRQAVTGHGLTESVRLMGYSDDFDAVLSGASVFAMGSRAEGFPMVLVEAMGHGLPLIAFDCPRGPADVIDDGVNGRLVPDGDVAAYTDALREMLADSERRQAMAAAGLTAAQDYQMAAIGRRWTALLDQLSSTHDEKVAMQRREGPREQGRATMVVVVGSGRSGTSTIAGVLNILGVRVPLPEVPGDATNPRGFFEPAWVVERQKGLLGHAGARLTDARPAAFAHTEDAGARPRNRELVATWLRGQVWPDAEIVVKDPRNSWFLPMWRQAAQDTQTDLAFLTMLRHPAEVVASKDHYYQAAKQGDTPRHAQTRGVAGWINVALETERATRGLPRSFVRYNDLLSDWRAVARQLSAELDLRATRSPSAEVAAEVDEFVDPTLRRIRAGWSEVDCPDAVRDLAEEVWQQLSLLADHGGRHEEAETRLDSCRVRYLQMYGDAESLAQSSIDAAISSTRREARRQRKGQQQPSQPASSPGPAAGVGSLTGSVRRGLGRIRSAARRGRR